MDAVTTLSLSLSRYLSHLLSLAVWNFHGMQRYLLENISWRFMLAVIHIEVDFVLTLFVFYIFYL